jgi:hypothetical protein
MACSWTCSHVSSNEYHANMPRQRDEILRRLLVLDRGHVNF